MNDVELADLFDRAAKLAERVPSSMQATAFHSALQFLSTGSVATPERKPATALPKHTSKLRSAAGRPGPKAAVESLIADGYLNEPRLVGEIRDHLGARGWKYVPKEIATAVLRLLREGQLTRSKGGDGQYRYERSR